MKEESVEKRKKEKKRRGRRKRRKKKKEIEMTRNDNRIVYKLVNEYPVEGLETKQRLAC